MSCIAASYVHNSWWAGCTLHTTALRHRRLSLSHRVERYAARIEPRPIIKITPSVLAARRILLLRVERRLSGTLGASRFYRRDGFISAFHTLPHPACG